MKYLISIILLAATSISCKKLYPDDELSMSRQNYNGNAIRLDGYYYNISNDEYIFPRLFFYRNGLILNINGRFKYNEEVEEFINRVFINSTNFKQGKSNWGVFKIESDNIKFERWYEGSPAKLAYIREGKILNDTTFHITKSYRMKNGNKKEEYTEDEIYYFKKFSPKPDSTNKFIE